LTLAWVQICAADVFWVVACREVLVMVMRKHQRYFPVHKQSGEHLLPYFITVANGPIDPATVREGALPR
jgi:glycyl-tRNA synthetase